ncbi:MAG: GYF domain-containing protein, partial [Myxococcota bacterium]|nr:GYF domain-containing protein [Myxococcota bacterium]
MKITCPTCSARYSIDDGKVKGKAFKFTCKKCGQTHVYRGTADGGVTAAHEAAASYRPAPQPAGPGPDDPVWHVAVGEEQQGPYTTEQINEYIRANEIDPESYMWKEGMEDWLPVADVQEFAALWAAQQAGAAPPQAPMQDDQPTTIAPFSGMSGQASPPQPGELFSFGQPQAAPAPSASPSPFGAFQAPRGAQAAVASRGGADLFGAQQASPFEGAGDEHDEDVLAGADHAAARAAPSPRADARQMVGQRNENSILFSLASLQALASSGGRQAAAASHAAPQRPGFAGGDGSGLIDIRTVAPSIARKEERTDDIFGMGGGGVAASVAVPVLMKPIRRADDSRKPMYIMVGVIGVFAVAIVVLVAFLLGRDKPTERIIIQQPPGVVAVADTAAVVPASDGVADATAAEPSAKAEPDAGTAPDAGSAVEPAGEGDPAAKAEDAAAEPAAQDAGSGRT